MLTGVVERTEIMRVDGPICYKDEEGAWQPVGEETPVSMNFWGFTPDYFEYSEDYFRTFLSDPATQSNLKAEFFIPLMVNNLIGSTAKLRVLSTTANWFGVTYQADKPQLMAKIEQLIEAGVYPRNLWGK